MSFFDEVKRTFLEKEEIFALRYNAAKHVFILSCLVFFLDYFFIANRFFGHVLVSSLSFVYIFFLFSFFLYACFLIAKLLYGSSKINQAFLFLILFAIISIFSIPFIFAK